MAGAFIRKPVLLHPQMHMPVYFSQTKSLAFTSSLPSAEIYVAEGLDSKPTQLTFDRRSNLYPRWSPDGNKLFYAGVGDKIWVVNVDGSDAHIVIEDPKFQVIWPYVGKMLANFLIKP
jgi:Tol biopolymer transport system component